MKQIGSQFNHPRFGRVEVINVTPHTVAYRDAGGKKRWERKPESRRWRVGDRCWVVPDKHNPDVRVTCSVVTLDANRRPTYARCDDGHPVWHGAVINLEWECRFGRVVSEASAKRAEPEVKNA